ncbi:putative hydrolase [Raoultella planticola]|nr:putative hydrolase [Raoultella planticola]
MQQLDWQQRFEAWLAGHLTEGDSAHDISHFRRVWGTAQRLAEESQVDRLVLLTACYFHDIISLPKNHPERSRSSVMAAEKNAGYSPVVIPGLSVRPLSCRLSRD